MTDLSPLKTRLEEATGPDRGLDKIIQHEIRGFDPADLPTMIPDIGGPAFPPFTGCVSTVLELVAKRLPGRAMQLVYLPKAHLPCRCYMSADASTRHELIDYPFSGMSKTFPLAILTALITALDGERE